jgi:hypothetical protein
MQAPSKELSLYIHAANQKLSSFCKDGEKTWIEWYLAFKIEDIIHQIKLLLNQSGNIVMTNSTNLVIKKLYEVSKEASVEELRDHYLLLKFVFEYMTNFESADVLIS